MIVNPCSFIFLNVNNSWGWSFLTWVFLCVFYLLIRSFVWQVLFLILTTFIFGPMGKWGTHFPWHFWGFANKYKKSVGKLTFCYIRIFKIIKKKKKIKSEGHFLSGHKYVTNCIFLYCQIYSRFSLTLILLTHATHNTLFSLWVKKKICTGTCVADTTLQRKNIENKS